VVLMLPLVGAFWPLAAIVGGLAYVIGLFALRTVRPSDVRMAAGWVTERLPRRAS
jgi:hypothetical protein